MTVTQNIAKHLREVHVGTNWTWSNLKEVISDVTWQEATTKVYDLNTIAALTYHISYYISSILQVLQGGLLTSDDKLSFLHPPIHSQQDWETLVNKAFADAEALATEIEKLPDEKMWETFTNEKYGIYYRNLHGAIEHFHYHLGQIAVIKKIIRQKEQVK